MLSGFVWITYFQILCILRTMGLHFFCWKRLFRLHSTLCSSSRHVFNCLEKIVRLYWLEYCGYIYISKVENVLNRNNTCNTGKIIAITHYYQLPLCLTGSIIICLPILLTPSQVPYWIPIWHIVYHRMLSAVRIFAGGLILLPWSNFPSIFAAQYGAVVGPL